MTPSPLIYTHIFGSGHCLFVKFIQSGVTVLMTYKSPKYPLSDFSEKFAEQLKNSRGKLLVFGDVNIDLKAPEGKPILKLFEWRNLDAMVDIQHPSTDYGTHIDCCFSNVPNAMAWFYESYYSYHKAICIVWPK